MQFRSAIIVGFLTVVISSCSASNKSKLPEAVFEIPVYTPSKMEFSMGSKSGGDGFVVDGMGWEFKTDDDPKKVSEWYQRRLPGSANKIVDDEDGSVQFVYQPKGAEEHEQVEIQIKKGSFLIHEDVLPGKRK